MVNCQTSCSKVSMSKEENVSVPTSSKSSPKISTKLPDHDEKTSDNVPLHESLSDSLIFRRAITKSANDLRTIGDCEFKRRSMRKVADTVDDQLRKSQNRMSDSLLLKIKGLPRPSTCPLCGEGSRVDLDEIGLEMTVPPHRHDIKKNNTVSKSSDIKNN